MPGIYETQDFVLAAYLRLKIEMLGMRRENGRISFRFKKYEDLEKDISDYFSKKGMVDALTFYDSIKALKTATKNLP